MLQIFCTISYVKFVHSPLTSSENDSDYESIIKETVMDMLFSDVRIKIIYKKEAYFLHELLKHDATLSEINGLKEPAIKYSVDLKRKLIGKFSGQISFFPSGKYIVVHASDTNPFQYGVTFLHGCGL